MDWLSLAILMRSMWSKIKKFLNGKNLSIQTKLNLIKLRKKKLSKFRDLILIMEKMLNHLIPKLFRKTVNKPQNKTLLLLFNKDQNKF